MFFDKNAVAHRKLGDRGASDRSRVGFAVVDYCAITAVDAVVFVNCRQSDKGSENVNLIASCHKVQQ
jgi:hypothetical protein